jgi:hypothetical protein
MSAYPAYRRANSYQPRASAFNHPEATHRNGQRIDRSQPAREVSQDESFARATKPAPAAKKAVTNDNPKLWVSLNTIRDPNTATGNTTRAMVLPQGIIVNTRTRGPAGMCEALVFIPGASLSDFLAPTT